MAYTPITDVIYPTAFAKAVTEAVISKSALLSSGAIVRSDYMNEQAAAAGASGVLPSFGLQTWTAPEIATDDATPATVNGINMGQAYFQKDYLTKTWGAAELTNTILGDDIVDHIVQEVVAPYWVDTYQAYALAKLSGIIKDNIANDGGDMVKNFATDAAAADSVAGASVANFSNIAEALQTMGDARAKIALMIMPSRVWTNLFKQEPTNCTQPSTITPFATYQGMPVIVDDSMPTVAGTNRTTYTVYLLGKGSIVYGEADLGARGVTVKTDEFAGRGWGLTGLISRKQLILQPVNFSSVANVVSHNGSPTLAAYDTASAWDRKAARKNTAIVALKVNG